VIAALALGPGTCSPPLNRRIYRSEAADKTWFPQKVALLAAYPLPRSDSDMIQNWIAYWILL